MRTTNLLKKYFYALFIFLVYFLFCLSSAYSDSKVVMTLEQFNRLKQIQQNLEKKITSLNLALTLLAENPGNVKKVIESYNKQLIALRKTKNDIEKTLTASIANLNQQIRNLTESEKRQKQEVKKQLEIVKKSEERLIALEKLLKQLKKDRMTENITWCVIGVATGVVFTIIAEKIITFFTGGNK